MEILLPNCAHRGFSHSTATCRKDGGGVFSHFITSFISFLSYCNLFNASLQNYMLVVAWKFYFVYSYINTYHRRMVMLAEHMDEADTAINGKMGGFRYGLYEVIPVIGANEWGYQHKDRMSDGLGRYDGREGPTNAESGRCGRKEASQVAVMPTRSQAALGTPWYGHFCARELIGAAALVAVRFFPMESWKLTWQQWGLIHALSYPIR